MAVIEICFFLVGELGLLQPPEALQNSHQRLSPCQAGERTNQRPLWDTRVPG